MAGFFEIVLSHHKKNKKRAENFNVFKACMAGAALLTMADGNRDKREEATLSALLKTLDELKLYKKSDGTRIYTEFVEAIGEDGEAGKDKARAAIAEISDDPGQAALVAAICATILPADGMVSDSETDELNLVCDMLGLDAAAVMAFDVDARDHIYD